MIYFRDNNGNEQLIAGIAGAGQTITQSITNGVTDKAPSSDAVYDNLKNYVQQKVFDIPNGSFVNGMDLTSYVNSNLSTGYEFLSWVMIMSSGWIIDHPIYMTSPGKKGYPYTNETNIYDLKVYFLERRII